MTKYTFNNDNEGYSSGYESEGGSNYHSAQELGEGTFSRARLFQSKDVKGKLVILSPQNPDNVDFIEIHRKYEFYKSIYIDQKIDLIKKNNTYRLIVPYSSGEPYHHLEIKTKKQAIKIFISAVKALKHCHQQGYVVIDLKEDNIFYDKQGGTSNLIDGGISIKKGRTIDQEYQQSTLRDVIEKRKESEYLAPEFWDTRPVRAHESMDIYSLAYMMKSIIPPIMIDEDPMLRQLLELSQSTIANCRPTLEELYSMLIIIKTCSAINSVSLNFSSKFTKEGINKHKESLLNQIKKQYESDEIYCALNLLKEAQEKCEKEIETYKTALQNFKKQLDEYEAKARTWKGKHRYPAPKPQEPVKPHDVNHLISLFNEALKNTYSEKLKEIDIGSQHQLDAITEDHYETGLNDKLTNNQKFFNSLNHKSLFFTKEENQLPEGNPHTVFIIGADSPLNI